MEPTLDRARIERLTREVLEQVQRRGGVAVLPADQATAPESRGGDPSGIRPPAFPPRSRTLRPEELGVTPEGFPTVTCNVSNRHIHVTREDLEQLFGPGSELQVRNHLMQPGQFASEQTVSLIAGRGRVIQNVRILGPCRRYTQVEISRTDGFFLGIQPPVRNSGQLKGSAAGTLVGPKGTLVLKEGIIIADRHIHTTPEVATSYGLDNDEFVRVRIGHTDKPTILDRVRIRVLDEFVMEMHLDNDDANACGVSSGDRLEILIEKTRS
jgi:putative phosphotransacetylase